MILCGTYCNVLVALQRAFSSHMQHFGSSRRCCRWSCAAERITTRKPKRTAKTHNVITYGVTQVLKSRASRHCGLQVCHHRRHTVHLRRHVHGSEAAQRRPIKRRGVNNDFYSLLLGFHVPNAAGSSGKCGCGKYVALCAHWTPRPECTASHACTHAK